MKIPIPLTDGLTVESVFYGSGTLCISCQAGCALRCPFCASGARGLFRNLSTEEMIGQVEAVRGRGLSPARITVSGIGEPLHNPQAVREFQAWCRSNDLPVSLTTTGAPLPVLGEFMGGPDNGLMISLHAGSAATHRLVVPRGPDYEELWAFLEKTWPHLPRRRRRKIGINYLLLEGVNDDAGEIALLADRLGSFPEVTVHLLALNPVHGSAFVSPSASRVDEIHQFLGGRGLNVRRANRWRQEREGGCGTLMWGTTGAGSYGKVPLQPREVREQEVK